MTTCASRGDTGAVARIAAIVSIAGAPADSARRRLPFAVHMAPATWAAPVSSRAAAAHVVGARRDRRLASLPCSRTGQERANKISGVASEPSSRGDDLRITAQRMRGATRRRHVVRLVRAAPVRPTSTRDARCGADAALVGPHRPARPRYIDRARALIPRRGSIGLALSSATVGASRRQGNEGGWPHARGGRRRRPASSPPACFNRSPPAAPRPELPRIGVGTGVIRAVRAAHRLPRCQSPRFAAHSPRRPVARSGCPPARHGQDNQRSTSGRGMRQARGCAAGDVELAGCARRAARGLLGHEQLGADLAVRRAAGHELDTGARAGQAEGVVGRC